MHILVRVFQAHYGINYNIYGSLDSWGTTYIMKKTIEKKNIKPIIIFKYFFNYCNIEYCNMQVEYFSHSCIWLLSHVCCHMTAASLVGGGCLPVHGGLGSGRGTGTTQGEGRQARGKGRWELGNHEWVKVGPGIQLVVN